MSTSSKRTTTSRGSAPMEAFRAALDARMPDVLDRDLLIVPVGDLPPAGHIARPTAELAATDRLAVRRRFGLDGRSAQLVLIGKDGGVKARQAERVFDLDAILALIDTMPMRRAETRRP